MTMMKSFTGKSIIIIFAFTIGCTAFALAQGVQDIAPSTWQISKHTDLNNGNTYQQASLVKITSNKIMWGATADEMMEFAILAANGSWNRTTNTGKELLTIAADNLSGEVQIEGTSEGITITFTLAGENVDSRVELAVDKVEFN